MLEREREREREREERERERERERDRHLAVGEEGDVIAIECALDKLRHLSEHVLLARARVERTVHVEDVRNLRTHIYSSMRTQET
jgi:signal-transduction protein with cAMP-binding, CBS, and nucleotidyltransferase domain